MVSAKDKVTHYTKFEVPSFTGCTDQNSVTKFLQKVKVGGYNSQLYLYRVGQLLL